MQHNILLGSSKCQNVETEMPSTVGRNSIFVAFNQIQINNNVSTMIFYLAAKSSFLESKGSVQYGRV